MNSSGIPVQINLKSKLKKVEIGGTYNNLWNWSIALDENGKLWSWGFNSWGNLGDGTTNNSTIPIEININNVKFKEISTGDYHNLAIDEEGKLWAWGYNLSGQLGDGTTTDKYSPVQIMEETKFSQISAGENYNLAIDEEGNIWSWGDNSYGRLGNGTSNRVYVPTKIDTGNVKFKEISAGKNHSLALDENGNLWSWGYNIYGQLGNGTKDNIYIPVQI